MISRLTRIAVAILLVFTLVPTAASPVRADSLVPEKIDPVLLNLMSDRPLALFPVIVEMQSPSLPFGTAANVQRANEALELLRLYGTPVAGLALIDSAAGFANAAGIGAISLVPTVAYIHHDATVAPAAVPDPLVRSAALDPLPTPTPLPTALPTTSLLPTPTPSPTAPPATPTPTPTDPATPTPTPTPTDPATPTPTPTPTPIASPTPSPTPTPTATPSPAPDASPVATPSPAPTASPTPAPAPTVAPTPSPQVSPAAAPSADASASPTPTPTGATQTQAAAVVYPQVVNADQVWSTGTTGRGVTIAVLDSGVAGDPDLTQPTNRILASVNFADERTTSDPGGHGTHVAGIIAGNGTRSAGEFVGIAPQANIVDVRVLGRTGSGRISSVVRGIEWVLAHQSTYNIRILNLSFGARVNVSYRTDPLSAAIEIAWRRGLVVVAASGNGGPSRDSVVTPGIDPYAITVGATDDQGTVSRSDDALAWFSAWGSADSNPKPDVVAPGRRIVSIRAVGSALDVLYPDRVVSARNGATYLRLSGTSMATPVVAGAVALILERRPDLTPDQVKAILMATAQSYGATSGAQLPDPIAGGSGLLDALAASSAGTSVAKTTGDTVLGTSVSTVSLAPANRALRPANGFARTMFPVLTHVPLRWKNPTLDGIAWDTLTWESVAWDSVAWDNFDWDSVAWDSVAWDSVAWDSVAWDSVAWDSVAWDAFSVD